MEENRSIICALVGHVDHGKSSLLDTIINTKIVSKEAGNITQAIGASTIKQETLKKTCQHLIKQLKIDIKIPGILFIDTPGHAAFSNLRKRGGNIADIAILIIDINEGFKPQTTEAIQILKSYKTPFIIAANKIDLIPGWKPNNNQPLITNINQQNDQTKRQIETKTYEIVAQLSEQNLDSERFDRVDNLTQKVAIIPCSTKTQEGIPEILTMLIGIGQKYMQTKLQYNKKTNAKGTILEIKKEKGIGTTIEAIIYDGKINKNDKIIIGTPTKPIITKIKTLYTQKPETDTRDTKTKTEQVQTAEAAAIIRITAPNIEEAIAGAPIQTYTEQNKQQTLQEIQKQIEETQIKTHKEGIIIKADAIGSIEALNTILEKETQTKIMKAEIGPITKKDIATAETNKETNPTNTIILGFNIEPDEETTKLAKEKQITIITHKVIYQIIEDYKKWKKQKEKEQQEKKLTNLPKPFKIKILKNHIFRQSNPLIAGTEIIQGTLQTGATIKTTKGNTVKIKEIQDKGKNIKEATKGMKVAVSYEKTTLNRQIKEEETFYPELTEEEFRKYKKNSETLTEEEKNLLKEIAETKRKENPLWGV